jgi:cytochrome c oxidase subunit 4
MRIDTEPRRARTLPFVVAWAVLLALAGASIWSAFLGMGRWAPIVEFGLAALQAATVFLLFMRLKGPPSLRWVFAFTGFFWLLFLYGLSMSDYSNRRGWPPVYNPSGPAFEALHNSP